MTSCRAHHSPIRDITGDVIRDATADPLDTATTRRAGRHTVEDERQWAHGT